MKDTVYRQAAIKAVYTASGTGTALKALKQLPSAQPSGKDPIEREAVVDILHDAMQGCSDSEEGLIGDIVSKVDLLPSAQPEPTTEIQEILNYLDTTLHPIVSPDNWNVYAELHDMVSKLSLAQPEPQWIPCSEGLPEMDGEYLCDYSGHIHIGQVINGHFRHYGEIADHLISAWMPLPEPYTERWEK